MTSLSYQQKYLKAKDKIRALEEDSQQKGDEITRLNGLLESQSVDLALMAPWRTVNDEFVNFVKEIADSHSKFARKARELLGRD